LFPGLSTIQTRPKYFLFIPQLLLTYLKKYQKHPNPPALRQYLRTEENNLMKRLARKYDFRRGSGAIGVNVAKANGELSRKPSSIYWNGLRIHGFIKTSLALRDYIQLNDLSNKEVLTSDLDADVYLEGNFSITTPPGIEISEEVDLEL